MTFCIIARLKHIARLSMLLITASGVLVLSAINLPGQLIAPAMENELTKLAKADPLHVDSEQLVLLSSLADQLNQSTKSHAHHYTLINHYWQWQYSVEPTDKVTEQAKYHLMQSLTLRPAWALTYLEPTWQHTESPLLSKSKRYQLALSYGAHLPQVALSQIAYQFEQWEQIGAFEKVTAATELLHFAQQWQYKPLLNQIIQRSHAHTKLCRTLQFNRVAMNSCKS